YDSFRDQVLTSFIRESAAVSSVVVDLGAGPCHEALLMRDAALRPLAIDLSPRMVNKCRERGIDASEMDITQLDLPSGEFGGVWASFSLLHLPKTEAPTVIDFAYQALRPGGIFCVLLFEGRGEGYRETDIARY